MAFKGFKIVAAMITVSELGILPRFDHPRQLMGYLGLVPSEATSSNKRRQGSITKCGNPHARWLLIDHRRLGSRGGDCQRQPVRARRAGASESMFPTLRNTTKGEQRTLPTPGGST
jgi:transposase